MDNNLYETVVGLVQQYVALDNLILQLEQDRPPDKVKWPSGVSSQDDINNYEHAVNTNDQALLGWNARYSDLLSKQAAILEMVDREIPEILRDVSIWVRVGDKRVRVLKSWNSASARLETYIYC